MEQTSLRSLVDGAEEEEVDEEPAPHPHDREVKLQVRPNRENITPLDCGHCSNGVAVPVMGIASKDKEITPILNPISSLARCANIFCERSIWNHDGPMADGDILELQGEMTEVAQKWRDNNE